MPRLFMPVAAAIASVLVLTGIARLGAQADPEVEHFLYGSIGIEENEGMPYWIWRVLPDLFPDLLPGPGGYASLGFVYEEGRDLPVGFSSSDLFGGPRVAINCAICHMGTYRRSAAEAPVLVPGAPSTRVDVQAYARFLGDAAQDERFAAGPMLAAIAGAGGDLSWFSRLTYRLLLIPGTRRALRARAEESAWMDERPDWGRGRIDPFNPVKFQVLDVPLDDTIGNSDMMPIWNLRDRDGTALHWDGLNTSQRDVLLSSAIGDGASRKTVDIESLERIERWLLDLQPPGYPFPIDQGAAARGEQVFGEHCATCHGPGGGRTWTVIPQSEVGTDRHRLDMWTQESADTYNAFADGYPWDFTAFRKTDGYVAGDLTGLWVTAPYLHNGSVPSLPELFEPPAGRTTVFFRGHDVYDPERVGFVSSGPEAERAGFRYDTSEAGNSNGGHLYGTTLPAEDKGALVEFLKTK
jgi:hypothetical protein